MTRQAVRAPRAQTPAPWLNMPLTGRFVRHRAMSGTRVFFLQFTQSLRQFSEGAEFVDRPQRDLETERIGQFSAHPYCAQRASAQQKEVVVVRSRRFDV